MMTVHEVSKLTGVSIRTLQYYDKIGLLRPAQYTDAGYRLYDDAALETLQQILLFRELEFPLKDIGEIIGSPDFDRSKALEQQIKLLTLKKEHIENLIDLAKGIKAMGVRELTFDAFDTRPRLPTARRPPIRSTKRSLRAGLKRNTARSVSSSWRSLRSSEPSGTQTRHRRRRRHLSKNCRISLQSISIHVRTRS